MKAVQIDRTGDVDVMSLRDLPDPIPGPGQVVIDVAAIGLNYIDVYQRSGLYPAEMPLVLGFEGSGTIRALGEDVPTYQVGQTVAWAQGQGSYAEQVVVEADKLLPVPDDMDLQFAAAIPLQGMTAHFLVTDCYPVSQGTTCLIHAGAGGVGQYLIQMAKILGAEVYTTVGSDEKAEVVSTLGADHIINYRATDFVSAVEAIGGERPIDVVYDGVGAATFEGGLKVLTRRGVMVTFGNASGPVPAISPLELSRNGSLYLTRPTLFDYATDAAEIAARADDLFRWIGDSWLTVNIDTTYALADVADAHRALEGRTTTGKVLLIP